MEHQPHYWFDMICPDQREDDIAAMRTQADEPELAYCLGDQSKPPRMRGPSPLSMSIISLEILSVKCW